MMALVHNRLRFAALALCLALAACTGPPGSPSQVRDYKIGKPYQVLGVWYYPRVDYDYSETGIASWYGPGFHGKKTANGEAYDQMALTAAHRTLPMPSLVRVTNLQNGRSLVLRVNDRGPFKNGRIIDLSRKAAQLLGVEKAGTAKVRVEILEAESRQLAAIAQGRLAAESAPEAVPTVAVDAAPLAPIEIRGDSQDTAKSTLSPGAADRVHSVSLAKNSPQRRKRLLRRSDDTNAAAVPDERPTPRTSLAGSRPLAMAAGRNGIPDWDAENALPRPDGTVTQVPVSETSIFIQAGSFLRRDYATRLSVRLSVLGRSRVTQTMIEDRRFFRVRLGPIVSVDEADRLLEKLQSSGFKDARVIVD